MAMTKRRTWRVAVIVAALIAATVGFQPAAQAAISCTPTAITPARWDFGNGEVYVAAGGVYACAQSVEIIKMHINTYRDGALISSTDHQANRRAGNKLLSLTVYQSPNCAVGTYAVDVEAWSYVYHRSGFLIQNSHGTASSPAVAITFC